MAFTDKGTAGVSLAIAFATENPVKAKLTGRSCVVTFSTDLADGAEGSILLTQISGATDIAWPSNVLWQDGHKPVPRGNPGDVAHFKLIRDNGANVYVGRLVVSGAA